MPQDWMKTTWIYLLEFPTAWSFRTFQQGILFIRVKTIVTVNRWLAKTWEKRNKNVAVLHNLETSARLTIFVT